jgi:hypothetical protein
MILKISMISNFTTVSPGIGAPISHASIQINFVWKSQLVAVIVDVYSILSKVAS